MKINILPKIGIAIAAYNSLEILKESLNALLACSWKNISIVVLDDSSTDGTADFLRCFFPSILVISGNGNLWWTGGTNEAVKKCLEENCDYIIIQNPDSIVQKDTIKNLYSLSIDYPKSIIAPMVVDYSDPNTIWWAGSRWERVFIHVPFLWTSRYIFKKGTPVSILPNIPYQTSEAHGRTVLVPRQVFDNIGLYDEKMFPHYGADTDFSFRARSQGYAIWIAPLVHVRLYTKNSGMQIPESLFEAVSGYWAFLTKRKNGEIFFVWWRLTQRHLPFFSALYTFAFVILLNTYRYWCRALSGKWK